MSTGSAHPNYVVIWVWLIVLTLVSVAASFLPLSSLSINTFVFIIAAVKSALVILFFMHLKFERALIWMLLLVPLCFFIILTAVLVHDIVPQ
jgi:cytochrome c oxidase subunit 4